MAANATNLSTKPVSCVDCEKPYQRASNRQLRCAPCQRSHHARQQRQYRKDNPEKISAINREQRAKNLEARREYDRQRHKKLMAECPEKVRAAARKRNKAYIRRERQKRLDAGWAPRTPMTPEERLERGREIARERYRADPLRGRMSVAVRRVMRDRKLGKSWEALVGYTTEDLREHIEKQFLPRMGWDNFSEWHVDHIIPLREFDCSIEEDFRAAWALSNLRPLWGSDNVKKGGKRLHLI